MQGKAGRTGWFVLVLTLIVVLSFWNIIFTKQFTTLAGWEIVNQAYTWYTFAAKSIQHGSLPLWDPYRFGGNSFVGEMQPGLFYPFKLPLYLASLDSNGMLSERAFNQFHVFAHWLAAIFMFALARHLRLGNFASLLAAVCFGLGGFLRVANWPNIIDAMVWLPFVLRFALRAMDSPRRGDRLFNAAVAGAGLGMTFLAGSIHVAIMDTFVVVTLATFLAWRRHARSATWSIATVVVAIGIVSALTAAVQLLPSLEYAPQSYRWVGADSPFVSDQKIPYPIISHKTNFSPKALFALVLGEADAGDSDFSSYLGVMPLLLAVIGAWKCWDRPLVRYVTALAAVSFVYTWGAFSFIHGALYLVPYLDLAREADRFIYLTQFAMALLAGYGVHAIFERRAAGEPLSLGPLLPILKWAVIVFAAALGAASLGAPIRATDLTYLSFFFMAASLALLVVIGRPDFSRQTFGVMLLLIVWDLYAFAQLDSKIQMQAENRDFHAQLVRDGKLVDFLNPRLGDGRVHFDAEFAPNLGHAYGVPLTWGMSATMLIDYTPFMGHPRQNELFSVKYTVRRKEKTVAAQPVYSDDVWNVYENSEALSRGWIVHRFELDSSGKRPPRRLEDRSLDLSRVAILEESPGFPAADPSAGNSDRVRWLSYDVNSLAVEASTAEPGLLVLSETFYPGWSCEVDGAPAKIYRTNGILRGVVLEPGTHRVSMRYRPYSVVLGAAATLIALAGVGAWAAWRVAAAAIHARRYGSAAEPNAFDSTV